MSMYTSKSDPEYPDVCGRGVRVAEFETCAIQSECKIVDASGKSSFFPLPAPWCVNRCINDLKYLRTDSESSASQATTQTTSDTPFTICEDPRNPEQHISSSVVSVMVTRNIQRVEEIIASYGPSSSLD